jgi:GH25 family lysozyme M1 (1,4-beta-N-acetylmuramidase)
LNFDGDGRGGDIVVLSGTAEVDQSASSAADNPAWIAKYGTDWERSGMTAVAFAQRFSLPVRIRIAAVHGR